MSVIERAPGHTGMSVSLSGSIGSYSDTLSNGPALYFRVALDTAGKGAVRNCYALMTDLWVRYEGEENYTDTALPHPVQLRHETFDVLPLIPTFVDFMRVPASNAKPSITAYWPHSLESVFDRPGDYQFVFSANGDGITAKSICIEVHLDKEWKYVTAKQVPLRGRSL